MCSLFCTGAGALRLRAPCSLRATARPRRSLGEGGHPPARSDADAFPPRARRLRVGMAAALLSSDSRVSGVRRLTHSGIAHSIVALAVVHFPDEQIAFRVRLRRQAVEMKELPSVVPAVTADRIEQR